MKLAKFAFVCAAVASLSAIADGEAVSSTLAILKANNSNGLRSYPVGINFAAADGAVSVSNAVKTASLPTGTLLYVWDPVATNYVVYSKSGNYWSTSTTVYYNGTNATTIAVSEPNAKKLPAGSAAFIQFPDSVDPTQYPIILAGNLPVNPSVTVTPGVNLICAPVAGEFNLNSANVDWGTGSEGNAIAASTFTQSGNKLKVSGDIIQVPTSDGGLATQYHYKQGTGWVKPAVIDGTNTYSAAGCTVPAGQAFWYIRKAGTANMTISWKQ